MTTDTAETPLPPLGLYIDGTWRDAERTFPVIDPADETLIANVADADTADARVALDAAHNAQESWRAFTPRGRAALFYRLLDLLTARKDAIIRTMTRESGKPLSEAAGEFNLSMDFLLWYTEQIGHLHGSFSNASHGGFRIITTHQPIGPCLLIAPWNFPLLMLARKAGAALAAGCTAIIKPAEETPITAAFFAQAIDDAGFPSGVVNLLPTTRAPIISQTLMADPRLRKASFTGSTNAGAKLLGQAAPNIMNMSLELGGDGPFIVLDDADLDLAVEQAVLTKFRNAGQACVAANRIIVDSAIEVEFTEKFVARTRKLTVGPGSEGADIGPLISSRQKDRVTALVQKLHDRGGTLLTGGRALDGKGFFYEPTVFRFPNADSALCGEELFAPVATIFPAPSIADAVTFANTTHYGLSAYLFTRDISRAIAIGEKLEAGMIGINRGIMADPAAPFGGVKASGLGREAGHHGIYEFLEPKYLALTIDDGAAA